MNQKLPIMYLARHGEAAWSLTGQHIERTNLPLTKAVTSALTKVIWILALLLSVVLSAQGQQTDDVQKQIEQLKKQYEQTTRELQERIAALEEQQKKERETKENPPKKEAVG